MKHILTIDGGGIRGIIPAKFCVELEQLVNSSDDKSNVTRLSDVFDLIAGTSTGGIIALALAKSTEDKSKMSVAEDILNLYKNKGHEIFSNPRGLLKNLFWPKYDAGALEKALRDYFGDTKLGEAKTHVVVTYYDLATRSACSLTSWDNPDYLMREAARATSAAPTVFSPAFLQHSPSPKSPFVDGGIFANNPAGVAYLAAQGLFRNEDMLFVAVGTGTLTQEPATMQGISARGPAERITNFLRAPGWGLAQWAAPLLPSVFDGISDFTDDIFEELLPKDQYYRMQIPLTESSEKLDNVTPENISKLDSLGVDMINMYRNNLDMLIPRLQMKSLPKPKSKDSILAMFSMDKNYSDPDKVRLIEAAIDLLPSKPEILKLQNIKQLNDTYLSFWHGIFLPIPYHQGFDEHLIDRLVAWVRDGGGRLVITGYELGERHHATNINQLVWNFGLRFNSDVVVGPASPKGPGERDYNRAFTYKQFLKPEHPLLKGVQCICARNACSLNLEPGSEPLISIAPNKIRDFNPEEASYVDRDLDGVFELSSPVTRYGKAYEDPHRSFMAIAPAGLTGTGKGSVLAIGTWDFRPDENSPKDNNNEIFISNIWKWLCQA